MLVAEPRSSSSWLNVSSFQLDKVAGAVQSHLRLAAEVLGDLDALRTISAVPGRLRGDPWLKAAAGRCARLRRAAGRPAPDMTLTAVCRRMGVAATPHGFRSTFRDWCSERTNYPNEAAERALAHTVGDKVEAAYRRGDCSKSVCR